VRSDITYIYFSTARTTYVDACRRRELDGRSVKNDVYVRQSRVIKPVVPYRNLHIAYDIRFLRH
jgi:hypothetical protein